MRCLCVASSDVCIFFKANFCLGVKDMVQLDVAELDASCCSKGVHYLCPWEGAPFKTPPSPLCLLSSLLLAPITSTHLTSSFASSPEMIGQQGPQQRQLYLQRSPAQLWLVAASYGTVASSTDCSIACATGSRRAAYSEVQSRGSGYEG